MACHLKFRSHMRRAETGGIWHSCSITECMFTHMRSGCGQICHFLRTKIWSTLFRRGRRKLGVGPIYCGADFAPECWVLIHAHFQLFMGQSYLLWFNKFIYIYIYMDIMHRHACTFKNYLNIQASYKKCSMISINYVSKSTHCVNDRDELCKI